MMVSTTSRWAPIFVAAIAVAVAGCDGKPKADQPAAKADDGSVLSPYLAIAETLAQDSVEGLSESAARVTAAAKTQKTEAGMAVMLESAGTVGTADIAAARTAFKTMSAGMIEYMRAHPDKQAGHILVHCTMTFEGNGGRWVQPKGKVMNPYEGAMMLHCGDVLDWAAELPET
ncbi:MAG: DUF3347 domain-containing protein [Nannocystaceae bacterium]|nr:DUF3347 domain-containing protein [Nannocystaceae bacterium]